MERNICFRFTDRTTYKILVFAVLIIWLFSIVTFSIAIWLKEAFIKGFLTEALDLFSNSPKDLTESLQLYVTYTQSIEFIMNIITLNLTFTALVLSVIWLTIYKNKSIGK